MASLMIAFQKLIHNPIQRLLKTFHSLSEKFFIFNLRNTNPSLDKLFMSSKNSPTIEIIPTMEITNIHIDNEPSIHVEHFFDIQELEKVGLELNEALLFYRTRHFTQNPLECS